MNTVRHSPPSRQQGVSTLLIAMLFLAILTIVAVFGARVGIGEQRISGNEYRYKMAFQVAEAGLGQSIEFLKGNTKKIVSKASGVGWLDDGNPLWIPCSVAFAGAVDPCKQLPTEVAAGSYRFVGANAGKLPVTAIPGTTDSVGGFTSSFTSYATLCRLDLTNPAAPTCSLSPSKEGTFYVTVVSVGTLAGESTTASVKQSFGTFRTFGRAPDAPLIAAGAVTALGNAQLVPNPNAGGFGIPVSVWSKDKADIDQASFATCHLSPWLSNDGGKFGNSANDSLVDGVCASCTCNNLCPETGGLISGNAKSCVVAKDKLEGEDILDVDGHASDASPKVRDSKYFPSDLFAYVFGIPSSGAVTYLTANAAKITNCDALGAGSSGLIWVTGAGATCKLGANVGSVQDPVVLVSDVPVDTTANGQFFGIVYVRSVAGTGELLKAAGGAQFYGSIILEGGGALAGTPTVVYNNSVLQNILNSPSFVRYAVIPGSWSDTIQN